MTMAPSVRKLALTAHVAASVGWLGAVAAFLALAVVGIRSHDEPMLRAMYVAMDVITRWVIVPACLASFLTGVVQAVGTKWGLVRHHWVLAKLFITVVSTLVLFVHTRPIAMLAHLPASATLASAELTPVRWQLLIDSAAALVALLVATLLSVYKPAGLTGFAPEKPKARESRA
jgi:hypothetical protein